MTAKVELSLQLPYVPTVNTDLKVLTNELLLLSLVRTIQVVVCPQ